MPLPTATTKIIASGAWARVRVKINGAWETIGLATNASYSENFALQDANVIGHLGPVSIDSQGYQCTVSIGSFVPEVKNAPDTYPGSGTKTLADLLPTRSEVQIAGKGKTFESLQFLNIGPTPESVLAQFDHVIVADSGVQINPNNYVTQNIQFRAIQRSA